MSEFLRYVDAGRLGLNAGLHNCFDKFNDFLCNTQKATYYAIGGAPSSGKSALIDDNFILSPYMYYMAQGIDPKIKWFYYSFEISKMAKRAKWTAYKLFTDYNLTVDSAYILSKGKNRCSDEVYKKVVEVDQYMEKLFDKIVFVQDAENPTGIYNTLFKYAEANGKLQTLPYKNLDGSTGYTKIGYVPNDPGEHVMIIIDHVELAKRERNYETKQNIDKLSEYMISVRNLLGYTPILVAHFNKGMSGIERLKMAHAGKMDLAPILEDFKNTGNLGQDCNIAIGVFNPVKHGLTDYAGYDLSQMVSSFRSIHLMKNREGTEYINIGMHFNPRIGKYQELPEAKAFEIGMANYKNYQ